MTTIADFLRQQAAKVYLRAHYFAVSVFVRTMTDEERFACARMAELEARGLEPAIGETVEEFRERVLRPAEKRPR